MHELVTSVKNLVGGGPGVSNIVKIHNTYKVLHFYIVFSNLFRILQNSSVLKNKYRSIIYIYMFIYK